MITKSVSYCYTEKQDHWIWNNPVLIKGNEVFCPMCEIWHENNSLCQMPMEGC